MGHATTKHAAADTTVEHGAADTTMEHAAADTTMEHGAADTTTKHGAANTTMEHAAAVTTTEHAAAALVSRKTLTRNAPGPEALWVPDRMARGRAGRPYGAATKLRILPGLSSPCGSA